MAEVTKELVQRRVADWITRLETLQSDVESWFSGDAEYKITAKQPVEMNEQLMREKGVSAQPMPCFELSKGGKRVALFQPNALFVIGANGRVDIFTGKGEAILVDMAQQFDPPQWKVFPAGKGPGLPFDRARLIALIELL